MAAEILLAEDNRVLRNSLAELLQNAGYNVRVAKDGRQALDMYGESKPDLLLLDAMMPRKSGWQVCEAVRETDCDTPIVFLTALDSEADELRALNAGADVHISKSVSDEILLARLAVLLRRREQAEDLGDFSFDTWRISAARHQMSNPSGRRVALTVREIAFLRFFSAHPSEVVGRDALLTRFWGADFAGGDMALTLFLHRLREKLGKTGGKIASVRGSGLIYQVL